MDKTPWIKTNEKGERIVEIHEEVVRDIRNSMRILSNDMLTIIDLLDQKLGIHLISSSPSFDKEKFQLPRLPIVAR